MSVTLILNLVVVTILSSASSYNMTLHACSSDQFTNLQNLQAEIHYYY